MRSQTDSGLDVAKNMGRLRSDWHEFLMSLPPSDRLAGTHLLHRIGIQKGVEIRDWMDHFSSLTLLYANLQTEFISIDEATRCDANLAQLCLLISAFAEDRVADGQIRLGADEYRFVSSVGDWGFRTVDSLCDASTCGNDWVIRLCEASSSSMGRTYSNASTPVPRYSTIRKVVPARGYLGALIPLSLAARQGAEERTLRRMKVAFDCIMLGLQWLDDIVDWREDLENGDINLLLHLLRARGLDAYRHPDIEIREANVGFALLEHSLFNAAANHSVRWFQAARTRQNSLGCSTLANMISQKTRLVEQKLDSEKIRVVEDVAALVV